MRVVIRQPDFLPYLGYFDRLLDCDLFVALDDVQFQKGGWNHRDKIKTPRGPAWLTLAVSKGPLHRLIREVELGANHEEWVAKNLALIEENYRPAAAFAEVFPEISRIYWGGATRLLELNMQFLRFVLDYLQIPLSIRSSSDLGVHGTGNERLINLVRAVGGTEYLSGTGALDYLRPELFDAAGINLSLQAFRHPTYPQLWGAFEPYLSVLDVMMNCGTGAREVVRSCRPG
jgi:hypothetical protein